MDTALISPETQVALLRALCQYRPVGLHRHLRMLSITLQVNGTSGSRYSTQEMWALVSHFYNLQELDSADEISQADFALPDEYDSVIERFRYCDHSSPASPCLSLASAHSEHSLHSAKSAKSVKSAKSAKSASVKTSSVGSPEKSESEYCDKTPRKQVPPRRTRSMSGRKKKR